jgi:NAD(P)-dependent dehydrogenase (short-subunit alcohol dehydrogenase family)
LIGSIEGAQPAWSHAHYCAWKAAVIPLAWSAAWSYGRIGVRVNSVSPGLLWHDGTVTGRTVSHDFSERHRWGGSAGRLT